jgi:SAM-dependent methyltransferase
MSESHSVKGSSFWDREVQAPTHNGWMDPLAVRLYINERITGDQHLWPLDAVQRLYPMRYERALSIGCGTGALERDLIRRDMCGHVDAFDASIASIAIARSEAAEEHMGDRIRYFVADFNEPALPHAAYDAVFIHQALHHVGKLEKLLRAVLKTLRPGGLFYLDEFVGLSRDQWTDAEFEPYAAEFRRFPRELRRFEELPLPVHPHDPTEAVRSGEIEAQLRVGFHIDHFRGYGGAVLSVFGPQLRMESAPPDLLGDLIKRDRAAPRDFYAVIMARPKRGIAKTIASLRYFTEPKVKRIFREVAALANRRPTRRRDTSAR